MAAATGIASHRVWAKILEFVFGRSMETSSLGLNWIFSILASLIILVCWRTARDIRGSAISRKDFFLARNVLKGLPRTVRIRRPVGNVAVSNQGNAREGSRTPT